MLTLEGFARHQFVLHGREVRAFGDREWTESAHDLDFVFERDGQVDGVEVKNKLGYMDQKELRVKVRLCEHLGIRPVFVARMLPKSWIYEVMNAGGFVLVLRWQLYPWTHRELARAVHDQLGCRSTRRGRYRTERCSGFSAGMRRTCDSPERFTVARAFAQVRRIERRTSMNA